MATAGNKSRTNTFSIQTNLSVTQVLETLKRATAKEFHDAVRSPEYQYYGTVTDSMFYICNKKYGPYSSGPWIKGEVSKSGDKVVVNIEADIEEQMELTTKFLSPFFIAFGLLAMVGAVMMPESRQVYAAVAAGLFISPVAIIAIARRLLKSMQWDEVSLFERLVSGWRTEYPTPGAVQPQGVAPGKSK